MRRLTGRAIPGRDGPREAEILAEVYLHSCAPWFGKSVIVSDEFSIEIMREPRAAVMIVVEATWEDHGGTSRLIGARMENKSDSGACLRVETPIPVGSKLNIRSHREQFSGTAKYCLSDGMEYLVGIQRETAKAPSPDLAVLQTRPRLPGIVRSVPPVAKGKARPRANGKASESRNVLPTQGYEGDASLSETGAGLAASASKAEHVSNEPGNSPTDNLASCPDPVVQAKQHSPKPLTEKEKRLMRRKWLESALWSNKQGGDRGSGNGNGDGSSHRNGDSTGSNGDQTLQLAPLPDSSGADPEGDGILRSHVEYLSMEDIYLAAGIVNLRRGYSISKVVEMLRSEHMRGLSKEMKRAAVLMALDAAGITVADVLSDARARQDALNVYEAGQRKQAEAEWARKAEEIAQIQAELERVKEQFAARISRHLDAVTREKAAFSSWQTTKHQESQSMTEAAELCLKTSLSEAAGARPEVNLLPASARTM